jgi:hypothetical protein
VRLERQIEFKGLASGRIRIIGIGHGKENPNYGLGLMASVASSSLALFIAGQPLDFNTVDSFTGLTWGQIAIELLKHAHRKALSPTTFASDCVDLQDPNGPRVSCGDSFGYSLDLYPFSRFYVSKLGYRFEDFDSTDFHFDRFDPAFDMRQPETMYSRSSFWGLNRFVFYNLLANEAWPGGTLNTHFRQIRNTMP